MKKKMKNNKNYIVIVNFSIYIFVAYSVLFHIDSIQFIHFQLSLASFFQFVAVVVSLHASHTQSMIPCSLRARSLFMLFKSVGIVLSTSEQVNFFCLSFYLKTVSSAHLNIFQHLDGKFIANH